MFHLNLRAVFLASAQKYKDINTYNLLNNKDKSATEKAAPYLKI